MSEGGLLYTQYLSMSLIEDSLLNMLEKWVMYSVGPGFLAGLLTFLYASLLY